MTTKESAGKNSRLKKILLRCAGFLPLGGK
jgi:hypothetical protein